MKVPNIEMTEGQFCPIDDYMVEVAGCTEDIRGKVMDLVEQGWTVCGGVAIAAGPGGRLSYAQAMVKPLPPMLGGGNGA